MEFEVGKLYKCSDHLLMIYPTREIAATTPWAPVPTAGPCMAWTASYWSEELNCTVRCSEPNEIFVFLKEETIKGERYLNVLFGDKQGWIIYGDWLRIESVLNGI